MEKIAGESDDKKVCMISNGGTKFGYYFAGNYYQTAIGFNLDSKMYKFFGPCYGYDGCIYLPGSDALVTKQFGISGPFSSLIVYKNFKKRLIRNYNYSNMTVEYAFDTSNPDYTFKSDSGRAWPIGGYGVSDSGKWLAVEFIQQGIGILNIETMRMRRISDAILWYGYGRDPMSELAVSNDGRHVAIIGHNAGFSIIDVDANCGDEITNLYTGNMISAANACKSAPINVGDFIPGYHYADHPRFNEDGGELDFYVHSDNDEAREISLRASGYDNQKLDYLAIGDSFTSGEGETDDKKYLSGTNDEYEKCHVSINSYPFLVSDYMGIKPLNMANVACSGARIGDVIGSDLIYPGQGNRLGDKGLGLDKSNQVIAKTEAKASFLQGRVHQESFVKKYQPKSITIGIGGNDAGFMDKLQTCLSHDTCDMAGTSEGREKTATEIKGLFPTLVQTYQKIHEDSPNSRIYVIGYPLIIDSNNTCNLVNGYILDSTERQFMNEAIIYLDQVIESASRKAGVKYIYAEGSFGDQVLCGSSKPTAMNAIRLGDDITVYDKLKWFKPIGSESFHPNPIGHSLIADSITNTVNNFITYEYCGDGNIICPDETANAPESSSYWVPDGYHNYPQQKNTEYVFESDDSNNPLKRTVTIDNNSLEPNSSVKIKITSDPVSLGQFKVNDNGSLNTEIYLPFDLEEGYHTIHLYGTSFSGESIELYQVIAYEKYESILPDKQTTIDTTGKGKRSNTIESKSTKTQDIDLQNPVSIVSQTGGSSDSNSDAEVGAVEGSSTTSNQNYASIPKSSTHKNNTKTNSIFDYLVVFIAILMFIPVISFLISIITKKLKV